MQTIDEVNALIDDEDAGPPERVVQLCTKGKLVARFEELEQKRANAASRINTDSLSGQGGEAVAIALEMEAVREEMKSSMLAVTLRAMPRKAFRKLVKQHPPRRDEDGNIFPDDRIGFNSETIADPLVRACWVAPVITPERQTRLLDVVWSDRQNELLVDAAWAVNREDVDIPFSLAASSLILNSATE